jgi:hypothetical protein
MSNLAPGNVINPHDSFSFEATEINRGERRFNAIAIAIVDPERPSRDLPFIFPSRQRGRKDKPALFPAGVYITRVGLRIHQSINLVAGTYEIGLALGDTLNVTMPYLPPATPDLINKFDYAVGWAMANNEDFGRKRVELQAETLAGSGTQSFTEIALASGGLVAEAPILSDPTVATGDPLLVPWLPHFLQPGAGIAPGTHSGKRGAIILDVSGFIIDPSIISYESATAGMGYLLDV